MKRSVFLFCAMLLFASAEARHLGFGVDAFNRVVAVSVTNAVTFSPLSFELDSVVFAEAVDPIRRAQFASALNVTGDFESEYRPLARMPFTNVWTNGLKFAWVHMFFVDEPRKVDPAFRLTVQDAYGVEVCRARAARGIEAWVRTRFEGDFTDWRMPEFPKGDVYMLQDVVSLSATLLPSNGWKCVRPTQTVYCLPLAGGLDFYVLLPKVGRSISSARTRLTSATLPEILSLKSTVTTPLASVRLDLPSVDFVSTNELAGAFSYFRFPTVALKPFPSGTEPVALRQTMRFKLQVPPPSEGAEKLEGPFLFFIHDPKADALPVIGIIPE